MDALQNFLQLNENLPSWLAKIHHLTVHVAEQNARFLESARCDGRLVKRKSGSTESLRPNDNAQCTTIRDGNNDESEPVFSDPDIYVPPNPTYQCLSHASRGRVAANGLTRKRKPGSNASATSGHARFRTKSMVVVYYDSAVQESFESLHRSIAGARNNLRKGRTAASFKARMASLGMEENAFPAAGQFAILNPKMMRSGFGRNRHGTDFSHTDAQFSGFDEVDKDLEAAQNLCEVAAHQFLRDGDCRLEIDGIRKRFENCLALAGRQVEKLKEEKEREEKTKDAAAESVPEEEQPVLTYVEGKVEMVPTLKEISLTGTGAIEVDDGSDAESVHIDLSAFRARSRRV